MKVKPKYLNDLAKVGQMMKNFHIKPVQTMKFSFDPFSENTTSIRNLLTVLHTKPVMKTSMARTKIDIRSDRSEPTLDLTFSDGHRLIFKTQHLQASDVIERLDKFCKARDSGLPEADMTLSKMSGKPKKRK